MGIPRLLKALSEKHSCKLLCQHRLLLGFLPKGGLEPPRVTSHAPQTCASTSSATSAQVIRQQFKTSIVAAKNLWSSGSQTLIKLFGSLRASWQVMQSRQATGRLWVLRLPAELAFELAKAANQPPLTAKRNANQLYQARRASKRSA